MAQQSPNGGSNKKLTIGGLIGLGLIVLFTFLSGGDLGDVVNNLQNSAGQPAAVQDTQAQSAQSKDAQTQDAQPKDTQVLQDTQAPTVGPVSGLPVILWDDLPPGAQKAIRLIDQGGPFPYDKDGSTFGNREGILPDRPRGYYKEYTVITPGSRDRGARRIVAGADGELYYTDDHYDSFREVVR